MKKVITGNELYECSKQAVELLCQTVSKTLGPRGSNAIIDHSLMNPFITNDGVTIARNIESKDERINTILTLAKEASIKTDENVGDGTTTTLVLLESIFINGLNKIKEGINSQIIKKELDLATKEIINLLKKESRIPTKKDYAYVASVAANDELIGKLISQTYLQLKEKGSLKIKESPNDKTYIEILSGYTFDTILASPYFLTNKEYIEISNSYILIVNNEIESINELSEIINFLIDKEKKAIIVAKDYNEEVINEVLSLNFTRKTNVTLLKIPEYGTHQMDLLSDLELITKSSIVNNPIDININKLGICHNIKINKEYVLLASNISDEKIKKRVNILKKQQKNTMDTYELEFLNNRIAKLTNGMGVIYVGAQTITEKREKKMRFDDALYALESLNDGILPGGGISLLKINNNIKETNIGYEILKKALDRPFKQILENVGLDYSLIYHKIKESNFNLLYNVSEDKYESVYNTKVVDPTKVIINALQNASSIASMLLTTSTLIINEYHENNNYSNNLEI